MCKISRRNVHWCWRYSCGQTTFSNILSICANKNGNKSAILNLILKKLPMIHGRIVIKACVKYWKKIFIGVGDIHQNGQILDGRSPNHYPPHFFLFWWGVIHMLGMLKNLNATNLVFSQSGLYCKSNNSTFVI